MKHEFLAFGKGSKASAFFINNSGILDYLRAKIAVAARQWLRKL
jgi:hypothetical protein